jgi:hypothetical protein
VAAMFPDGLAGDKQSQTGALAAFGGVKHGEHIFDLVRIHSAAVVDDVKLNIVVFAADPERYLAFSRMLIRVERTRSGSISISPRPGSNSQRKAMLAPRMR